MTYAAVVDSSVLIAILNEEPEAVELERALNATLRFIGWPTVFETRIWTIRRKDPRLQRWLERFLELRNTTTVRFDSTHEGMAAIAFERFGKGRHPASLNFGDCMTYAVARNRNVPLLFKGGDFGKTDIAVHPASVIIEQEDI